MNNTYALDFETFYSEDYSIRKLHPWQYIVTDPRFDAYLLAVCGTDGYKWVGNPKDFDWHRVDGQQLCAHNVVGFEGLVLKRLQRNGLIYPEFTVDRWFDTSDLAVFMRTQRNLAAAAKYLLNREISKASRNAMKGKTWAEAMAKGWKEKLEAYVLSDATACLDLYKGYHDKWPTEEQEFSRINRDECWHGINIDVPLVDRALSVLGDKRAEALRNIPWAESEKPLSLPAIRMQGRKDNIPVPASLDAKDPETEIWMDQYSIEFPWVRAIRDYRRLNTFYKRAESIKSGLRDDNTFMPLVKYHGAGTGRDSAGNENDDRNVGGKFNIKNITKEVMFGVDFRAMIIPPAGHVLVVGDWTQIEPRILFWRVGDDKLLERIRAGANIYQAHAETTMDYKGASLKTEDPRLYRRAKDRVIGMGYQCGWKRYQEYARQADLELTEEQARLEVDDYRATNPRVVNYWAEHNKYLWWSINHNDENHIVDLASGRKLTYWYPHIAVVTGFGGIQRRAAMATYFRGGPEKSLYGGKLTENEIQATARDVLRDTMIAMDKSGIKHMFTAYDEIVSCASIAEAPRVLEEMKRLMCETVKWLPGCPLDAELVILNHYEKA